MLEDQNKELTLQIASLEDEYRRSGGMKSAVDNYKLQLANAENRLVELASSKERLEADLKKALANNAAMETEHQRNVGQVRDLEDKLKEAEEHRKLPRCSRSGMSSYVLVSASECRRRGGQLWKGIVADSNDGFVRLRPCGHETT